jgi:RES domain-containing protein
MQVWRITAAAHADRPLSGVGAMRFGNRWNSKGTALAYTAENRALAALELLVHLSADQIPGYVLLGVDLPDRMIERLHPLPAGWNAYPYSAAVQRVGDEWAASRRSLGLLVPAAVLPEEHNLLINPQHPGFSRVRVDAPRPFSFDPRLLSRVRRP